MHPIQTRTIVRITVAEDDKSEEDGERRPRENDADELLLSRIVDVLDPRNPELPIDPRREILIRAIEDAPSTHDNAQLRLRCFRRSVRFACALTSAPASRRRSRSRSAYSSGSTR